MPRPKLLIFKGLRIAHSTTYRISNCNSVASKLSRSGKSAAHYSLTYLPTLVHPLGSYRATISIPFNYRRFPLPHGCITDSSLSCTAGHSNELYDCSVFFSGDWTLFRIDARRLIGGSGFSSIQTTRYETLLFSLVGQCCSLPDNHVAQQVHYRHLPWLFDPHINLCTPSMYILHTFGRPLGRSLRH